MTMSRVKKASTVLTVRMGSDLDRSLAREARRRRTTKSAVVREILAAELAGEKSALGREEQEAQRQSLLVSGRQSEQDALHFVEGAADTRGWT